jgi:GNAT superfamily N-acetyltransferase
MVVVNSHGGNHFLVPVCRDINRRDGAIKIIIAQPWDFRDPEPAGSAAGGGDMDIHSGMGETSTMLAIAPDLVRRERLDMARLPEPIPLGQADLTTFGVGHFSAGGAIGMPSRASKAVGVRRLRAVKKNMIPFLKDRIERLRRDPRYVGRGGVAIRPMLPSDIPGAMRLKTIAGWNQTEATWEFLLQARPESCFAAVHQGQVVGTAAACMYGGNMAWIGMVLVDPSFRRMGIGSQLVTRAVESVSGCGIIGLDATRDGRPVYERLGFAARADIVRMRVQCLSGERPGAGDAVPVTGRDMAGILAMDRGVFGADRSRLLRSLFDEAPERAWRLGGRVKPAAYCFGRAGSDCEQIGPVVATAEGDALAVTRAAMTGLSGKAVLIDVPCAQAAYVRSLENLGFCGTRSFIRMVRGKASLPGDPAGQFASTGPEFG